MARRVSALLCEGTGSKDGTPPKLIVMTAMTDFFAVPMIEPLLQARMVGIWQLESAERDGDMRRRGDTDVRGRSIEGQVDSEVSHTSGLGPADEDDADQADERRGHDDQRAVLVLVAEDGGSKGQDATDDCGRRRLRYGRC